MEGTHRQLGSRFTDGLGGDDSDSDSLLDQDSGREIHSVAKSATTQRAITGERTTNEDLVMSKILNLVSGLAVDHPVDLDENIPGNRILDLGNGDTPVDTCPELNCLLVTSLHRLLGDAALGSTIMAVDDNVLGHISKFPRQVTGVSGLQGGVSQPLTRTVGRGEILQNPQSLAERRLDGSLDDLSGWFRHQSAHPGELSNLGDASSCAGFHHHENRIHVLIPGSGIFPETLHQLITHLVSGVGPAVDDLAPTFIVRDHAILMALLDLLDLGLSRSNDGFLGRRTAKIVDTEGKARTGRCLETEILHVIEKLQCRASAKDFEAVRDDGAEMFLAESVVVEGHIIVIEQVIEDDPARSGLVESLLIWLLNHAWTAEDDLLLGESDLDPRVSMDLPGSHGGVNLLDAGELDLSARHIFLVEGQIEATHHDVL